MNNDVVKWINSQTYWPIGNIIVTYTINFTYYSSLIEFIENICKLLNIKYIVVESQMYRKANIFENLKNILVFNANKDHVIENNSVKFIKSISEVRDFNYLVLLDTKNVKLEYKTIFYVLLNQKFNILLISLFFFFLCKLEYFRNPVFIVLIFFQFISLFLQKQLYKDSSNKIIKTLCKLGNSAADNCEKLKTSTPKLLNFFDFSELGIIYFFSILFYELLLINSNNVNESALSMVNLFSFLGIIFGLYSLLIQLKTKIFCPVCIFSIFTIGVQSVFYLILPPTLVINISIDTLLLFFIPICFGFFIIDEKIIIDFKGSFYKSDSNFKSLYFSNILAINNNFEVINPDHSKLTTVSISSKLQNRQEQNFLLFCIALDCPSCVLFLNNLKNFDESNFRIEIIFQISITNGKIENNSTYQGVLILAHVFNTNGFNFFLNALNEYVNYGFSEKILYKYIDKHYLKDDKLIEMAKIIRSQNIMLDRLRIDSYPFVILNNRIIPAYFDPKYYFLIK